MSEYRVLNTAKKSIKIVFRAFYRLIIIYVYSIKKEALIAF